MVRLTTRFKHLFKHPRFKQECLRSSASLLLMGTLIGCATTPVSPEQGPVSGTETPVATDSSADDPVASGSEPRPSADVATLALLQQSERAARGGELKEALAYAERAVRIDPRSAPLWTHLAALELQNGNAQAATQFANKALSLAANRPDWQRDAWLVIAAARESMGDAEGAESIRRQWQTTRG